MPEIIGGKFGLEELQVLSERKLPFLQGNSLLLASGRSGIRLLVNLLKPKHTWLPSYLCEVMVQAVNQTGSSLEFYAINFDLQMTSLDWLENVQPGDLVVGIAYFGFPVFDGLARMVKSRDAWFLEDDSLALFSTNGAVEADFRLYSLRKFCGVPDGAVLSASDPGFQFPAELPPPPGRWWLQALQAALRRSEFDRGGNDHDWFRLGRLVESATPFQPYRMSDLAQLIMRFALNAEAIGQARIENYRTLLEKLGSLALFPELPAGVIPLGFPVRLAQREKVRQGLFDQCIYPIVHWPLRGWVPDSYGDSHRLSGSILTLICDQRYGAEDMRRTTSVVETLVQV